MDIRQTLRFAQGDRDREAGKYGVVLEINAQPLRLDLNDLHIRMAKWYGAQLVISTDTHVTNQFDYMANGVSLARRRRVEKKDVLNTLPYPELLIRLKAVKTNKSKNYSTA